MDGNFDDHTIKSYQTTSMLHTFKAETACYLYLSAMQMGRDSFEVPPHCETARKIASINVNKFRYEVANLGMQDETFHYPPLIFYGRFKMF